MVLVERKLNDGHSTQSTRVNFIRRKSTIALTTFGAFDRRFCVRTEAHSLFSRFWLRACQRSPRNYFVITFRHFVRHLPNLKHITSCLTWIDTIVSNCIIRVKDKLKYVSEWRKNRKRIWKEKHKVNQG